jgi:hypothetical protein
MLLDMERLLVENFHWSLCDIDNTDAESMFDFIGSYNKGRPAPAGAPRIAYCDEVPWM